MFDLISIIVALIIMILFVTGIMMILIIMSHKKTDLEQINDDEDEMKFIAEWMLKKQKKNKTTFLNTLIYRIKKFLLGGNKLEEINQLELTAYILIISKKLSLYADKTIDNYLNLLEEEIMKTKKNTVLNNVRLSLFNDFKFRQTLDFKECKYYTILIFHRLLNYLHREFDEFDVITETKYVFNSFSVRTAKEEIIKLNIITNK